MPLVRSIILAAVCTVGCVAAPAQLRPRVISADLLAKLNLFEQYSAAAYCPSNNNSTNTKLTCSAGNCPLVESADTNTVTEFQNSLATDVTGFVATDATNSLIVVAFRGSQSIRNYLTDINFAVVDTDICSGCTASVGFYSSWGEARDEVLAAVESASNANPSYSVVATGHSLGGAIADFAAAELRNAGYATALYTFGAPRIGGEKISTYITNQSSENYRVTHLNDPVPRLPPMAFGFRHISPEYYISSANDVPVTTNSVTRYDGIDQTDGNAGQDSVDVSAHTWYFGDISACYPGGGLEWRKRYIDAAVDWGVVD